MWIVNCIQTEHATRTQTHIFRVLLISFHISLAIIAASGAAAFIKPKEKQQYSVFIYLIAIEHEAGLISHSRLVSRCG